MRGMATDVARWLGQGVRVAASAGVRDRFGANPFACRRNAREGVPDVDGVTPAAPGNVVAILC